MPGQIVALLVSATAKEISTPPAPAGFAKVTGNGTVLPGATTVLAGTMIGGEVTVTLALALEYPGALAMMVVDPADTPVTTTVALEEPAMKLAVGCTVATPGLVELKLTVNPEAAGADRIREKVLVPVPAMVALDGAPPQGGASINLSRRHVHGGLEPRQTFAMTQKDGDFDEAEHRQPTWFNR